MDIIKTSSQVLNIVLDQSLTALRVTGGMVVGGTYDYIGVSYPTTTTEIYTYKLGGVGGTTTATVTVVYTDSTKENLSYVGKS